MNVDYKLLAEQVKALTAGEKDTVANMANVSALLFNQLPDLNWAGFYRVIDGELVLGPFQGQPACIRIPMGKGVCGTAASTQQTQVVEDVHQFEGHIACDAASNSEIVIPVFQNGQVIAVLDIDSPKFARFNAEDAEGLQTIVTLFEETLT
ncbi:GAF domain-containing protein [Alteromonas flava]|uniref:GAF domain-containing protein n=1 Tax=Alteromonas flava TaxID=2048003 RepID=UPI000C291CAA|nr:GAF domain-containing protein [Alteromonas flava]